MALDSSLSLKEVKMKGLLAVGLFFLIVGCSANLPTSTPMVMATPRPTFTPVSPTTRPSPGPAQSFRTGMKVHPKKDGLKMAVTLVHEASGKNRAPDKEEEFSVFLVTSDSLKVMGDSRTGEPAIIRGDLGVEFVPSTGPLKGEILQGWVPVGGVAP